MSAKFCIIFSKQDITIDLDHLLYNLLMLSQNLAEQLSHNLSCSSWSRIKIKMFLLLHLIELYKVKISSPFEIIRSSIFRIISKACI
jgi:hypothetical protein